MRPVAPLLAVLLAVPATTAACRGWAPDCDALGQAAFEKCAQEAPAILSGGERVGPLIVNQRQAADPKAIASCREDAASLVAACRGL